jgi:hypothetical protein
MGRGLKSTEYCETAGEREKKTSGAELSWSGSLMCTFVKVWQEASWMGSHHGAISTKGGKEQTWWELGGMIGS